MSSTTSKPGAKSQLRMIGNDQRAWEGKVAGQRWIARVVYLDERAKICALHVSTDQQPNSLHADPNCHWDYEYEHLVHRYHEKKVPRDVADAMRDTVHEWVCRSLRAEHQRDAALTVRPAPPRPAPVVLSWLPAKEINATRLCSHLS